MKDEYQEPNIGVTRGRHHFRKGKNSEVGESSKWVPNKVYQTFDNPPNSALDNKNDPYRYCNESYNQLKVS